MCLSRSFVGSFVQKKEFLPMSYSDSPGHLDAFHPLMMLYCHLTCVRLNQTSLPDFRRLTQVYISFCIHLKAFLHVKLALQRGPLNVSKFILFYTVVSVRKIFKFSKMKFSFELQTMFSGINPQLKKICPIVIRLQLLQSSHFWVSRRRTKFEITLPS